MVNDSAISQELQGNESWETCQENRDLNSSAEGETEGEFSWDTQTQELLLAGFFYGYLVTQIPGGWLCDRFGMKWVFGFGMLLSSVCTLLGPVAAYGGTGWYFASRFFAGLGEGVTFPSMMAAWSRWAHPSERSRLAVSGFLGFNFGNAIGNALTGYLISFDIAGGWPFPFYIYGSLGCLSFIVWCFVGYSSPSEHPWISREERDYLEDGLKLQTKRQRSVPWGSILSSGAMWVFVCAHFGQSCGLFTLLVNLPLYYSDGIRVPLELAGLYSGLPYIMQIVGMVLYSRVADWIFIRGFLTKLTNRKLATGLGVGLCVLFLIFAGLAKCNVALSVTFVSLAMGAVGIAFSGHFVALLDVSGPFAGSCMGMMNTGGTLGGIVGPYIVGVVTGNQSDIRGWQNVMWIVAGIYAFGGLSFVIFGTVTLQSWARTDSEVKEDHVDNNEYDVFVS
eukprot:XP_001200871.2 PREDICTED: sialin-like [Strongylocentrotus purpuratus]